MIKAISIHHNFIKIISCIIGYTIWSFLAQYQTITIMQEIPICFYQTDESLQIIAPDSIKITLSGKRKDIYSLQTEQIALYLNAQQYLKGKHYQPILREHIVLPDHIKLVKTTPAHIIIEVIHPTT